jgi:hypothetical protein
MNWSVLVPIIVSYGLPVAEKLFQLWSTGGAPTQADWDNLKVLGTATRKQDMTNALIRNGVDPLSPQGQALLALVV